MTSTGKSGEEIFQNLVHRQGICDNCFEQTHFVEKDWWPKWIRLALEKHLQETKFYPDPEVVEHVYPPEKQSSYPSSRNICPCGVMTPFTKIRPLSRSELERNVENICDLLDDEGIPHDKRVMIREANRLKSRPEYQDKDDKIIMDAIEKAVGGNNSAKEDLTA